MSALSPQDVERILDVLEHQASELDSVRRELERQTVLLERLLDRLESLERTQYS
jgi:hypothetical protein